MAWGLLLGILCEAESWATSPTESISQGGSRVESGHCQGSTMGSDTLSWRGHVDLLLRPILGVLDCGLEIHPGEMSTLPLKSAVGSGKG